MHKLIHILPVGVAGYAAWRIVQLNRKYPIEPLPADSELSRLISADNLRFEEPDLISARVRLRSSSPLESYLSVFWSTWTLQVEGFLAKQSGYQSSLDSRHEVFGHGIFPVVSRSPTSLVVRWQMPGSAVALFRSAGVTMIAGGLQELSVQDMGDGLVNLSYACAQHHGRGKEELGGERLGGLGLALHRFYMRFLLDSAVRKLEQGSE